MATATTTIRVTVDTRDRLNALGAREGRSAGEIIASLIDAADEEALLDGATAAFETLAADDEMLAAYRAETRGLEAGFEAPIPAW